MTWTELLGPFDTTVLVHGRYIIRNRGTQSTVLWIFNNYLQARAAFEAWKDER